MKKYEAIFIYDIRMVDDEGEGANRELVALIESLGGKVTESVSMGRIQFSYEIKKRKAGIYWDVFFEIDESKIIAIKDKFRLDERVLRNMIVIDDRPAEIRLPGKQVPVAE